MNNDKMIGYINDVLNNMPQDWLNLTTHRLDIYDESLAKIQFLEQFENLYSENNSNQSSLSELPTAYDYIRLGHPLSCVLEWAIAKQNNIRHESVISFSSQTIPVLAILRKNLFEHKNTRICYTGNFPTGFDADVIRNVYGYSFDLESIDNLNSIDSFDGTTICMLEQDNIGDVKLNNNIDFFISNHLNYGSILLVNGSQNETYIQEIQHVRRRETIAMTPINCLEVLKGFIGNETASRSSKVHAHKSNVLQSIKDITGSDNKSVVGSSGLSIQYAIMMGLVDNALQSHKGKDIRFVVPPNCYGGTNDQARRVAACNENIEVMDLPVDGGQDMVQSIDLVLDKIAQEDAVPYIIAEIPTNPRVEVPDLIKLRDVLSKKRNTANGDLAIAPVFILDQTFCPNVHFLGKEDILSSVKTIAYVSGSKFPSGGKCTAGYCVSNELASELMDKIELHLNLCDNEATDLQYELLAKQMPSMLDRIQQAYVNTREFVTFIKDTLPGAKINFVSEELAEQGFTPSVFSLDLPTKGANDEERETYKRALNLKLIDMMINEIPDESKYCVSYGQLNGCYWTIPATSTQGTTKEGDKDYIARIAVSHNMDLERHKKVFLDFVDCI
ncbi:MAG: cystathionine beta-synthase [Crocinitomicaceae bacterium]|nr:cystathionine beta-synthase [Crocinitomicaceae bacterium]